MKGNKLIHGLTVFVTVILLFPLISFGESISSIEKKESDAKEASATLSTNLNEALTKANEKYSQVSSLQEQLENTKKEIKTFDQKIKETETSIRKRKVAVGEQMQDLQLNDSSTSFIDILLGSSSLSEVINRTIALNTIRHAQSEKINSLAEAQEKLENLKSKKQKSKTRLEKESDQMVTESSLLEEQVESLKEQSAKNAALMEQLANDKSFMQKEIADQKARDEAMEKAKSQASSNDASEQQTNTSSKPSTPQAKPSTPPSHSTGSGRQLTVQSTGYSCSQPGLGYYTATGIDLRKNPNCIAVDPSVIRLGSMVEIPGYGIAVAGDTGGAIVGNIIDLHFPTVKQCINWGRRTVTIKILS